MVIKDVSNNTEVQIQQELFLNCHQTYYYVLYNTGRIFLKERPIIKYKKSGNIFQFKVEPSAQNLIDDKGEEVSVEKLVEVINYYSEAHFTSMSAEDFCPKIQDIASNYGLEKQICELITKLGKDDIEFNNREFWLYEDVEDELMQCIVGKVDSSAHLFRYTTANTLQRILTESTHGMVSLASMNDPSEIDYAQNYLVRCGMPKELAIPTENSVHIFIVSMSDKHEDDLTMWRFYGDDCKGVSLEYTAEIEMNWSDYFLLSRVSYAREDGKHPELDFVNELSHLTIENRIFRLKRWNLWQHFFKPFEYSIEKEVRLLMLCEKFDSKVFNIKRIWITTSYGIITPIVVLPLKSKDQDDIPFPLQLKGVTLGCKFPEKGINSMTLRALSEDTDGIVTKDFYVKVSKIDNYR